MSPKLWRLAELFHIVCSFWCSCYLLVLFSPLCNVKHLKFILYCQWWATMMEWITRGQVEVDWSVSNNQHSTCYSYRIHMYRKMISLILGPHESHVMLTCFCYSFVWRSVWSLVFCYIKSILIKVIQIFSIPAHISYLSFCSSVEETNNCSAEGLLKEKFTQKWKLSH